MAQPRNTVTTDSAFDTFAPWMPIARSFVGLREILPSGELNPVVRGFFDATRFPKDQINKTTSWCSAYACTCLERASVRSPHSARARDFLPWGLELEAPVYGAILVFSRGLDDGNKGHVGFCAQPSITFGDVQVKCLGGNQDNQCCIRPKVIGTLLGVRWPEDIPLPNGAKVKA